MASLLASRKRKGQHLAHGLSIHAPRPPKQLKPVIQIRPQREPKAESPKHQKSQSGQPASRGRAERTAISNQAPADRSEAHAIPESRLRTTSAPELSAPPSVQSCHEDVLATPTARASIPALVVTSPVMVMDEPARTSQSKSEDGLDRVVAPPQTQRTDQLEEDNKEAIYGRGSSLSFRDRNPQAQLSRHSKPRAASVDL